MWFMKNKDKGTKSGNLMRIGILGAGGVAKDLHLPALASMPGIDIRWICDKDAQRARHLAKLCSIPTVYSSIEQCSDVDIVLIAIPVGYRASVMETVIERGWHVFCEKPFALTLSECDRYLALAHSKKVQVGVGLVRRYCPALVVARKLVSEQRFGPVLEAWANEGMRTKRTGKEAGFYMFDPHISGGGFLMETGSHLIDQLFTILDIDNFKLEKCTQWKYEGLELGTRATGLAAVKNHGDIKCSFEVSRLDDLCNGIFIRFSKFIMKCGLGFDSQLELSNADGESFAQFKLGSVTESAAFALEWEDFIEQCISGNPSVVSADTVRNSIATIEQCYENAEVLDVSDKRKGI
jgi:predicted dehydrogenase